MQCSQQAVCGGTNPVNQTGAVLVLYLEGGGTGQWLEETAYQHWNVLEIVTQHL